MLKSFLSKFNHWPNFWQKPSVLAIALSWLCFFYLLAVIIKNFFTKTKSVKAKIICIGNLTAGGQGKTPCALALGKLCSDLSINYAFLSRGYGGNFSQELIEVNENSSPTIVGDEPILLAQQAKTFVGKNRYNSSEILSNHYKFSTIILDDGLQNNNLKKDYKILVVDEKIMFGNHLLLPAGPLRELVSSGLKKVDLVIFVAKKNSPIPVVLKNNQVVKAEIEVINLAKFVDKKIIAFCGIAFPDKFFQTLKDHNLQVVQQIAFGDHHNYSEEDLKALNAKLIEAKTKQINDDNSLILLTTKKDWVKFSPFWQSKIDYLDIAMKFSDEELIKNQIKKIL